MAYAPNAQETDKLGAIGWIVECESPLEIQERDGEGFARGLAASLLWPVLLEEFKD
jgi:hypothetical protein